MFCGILFKLLVVSCFSIVFPEERCEHIYFLKRNIWMNCCMNNSLSINGSFYICQIPGGPTEESRSAVTKPDDDTIIFPDTHKNEVETTTTPGVDFRLLGDVPLRCPRGETKNSEGICVESWN
ncbi:hypothetical protein HHI36_016320 [Cryptolaemus montrouzieri]|uniref:Secreted protein n=1 Tax=Cryptolaemus montrouzieri TaxID=559131 RepID=A0ABD2NJC8_9CUCU